MIPSSNVGEIGSVWHVLALVGALRRKTDFQIIGRIVLNHGNKICSVTMIMICTAFKLHVDSTLYIVEHYNCVTFSQTQFLCRTKRRTAKRTRQACNKSHAIEVDSCLEFGQSSIRGIISRTTNREGL